MNCPFNFLPPRFVAGWLFKCPNPVDRVSLSMWTGRAVIHLGLWMWTSMAHSKATLLEHQRRKTPGTSCDEVSPVRQGAC